MKYFITGGTGFIGYNLINELLKEDNQIHILIRSPKNSMFPGNKNVTFFEGDLQNRKIIEQATKNCDAAFHLAAYANIWSKDKRLAYQTNVTGTKNILEAAAQNHVKKIVFTSSAAVLPPSVSGEEIDENAILPEKYLTEYETTKREAEELCIDYSRKGLHVVIVNPPRVFGPGLLNKSNSVTIMIQKYLKGKWRFIPADGEGIGNYVFVGDIINGYLLALKKGKSGERYILGGTNISYNDFFRLLAQVSGKNHRMIHIPFSVMLRISECELFMAETFGKKPLITPPWVRRYVQNRPVSSKKAINELGYNITPLEKGIQKTIQWLNAEKNGK